MREERHLNGRDFFGHDYRCVEQPRLELRVRCWRKTRTSERTWYVDGIACSSLDDVAEALREDPNDRLARSIRAEE